MRNAVSYVNLATIVDIIPTSSTHLRRMRNAVRNYVNLATIFDIIPTSSTHLRRI
jgi:DNA-directed RNA polymerase subunit F